MRLATLQFTALGNPDIQDGPLALSTATGPSSPGVFNHPHDIHTLLVRNLAEDDVLVIQMRRRRARDEELAPVGVGARVCHRQQASCGVFVLERFVGKRGVVIDARTAGAVGVEEVAALDHEVFDLS